MRGIGVLPLGYLPAGGALHLHCLDWSDPLWNAIGISQLSPKGPRKNNYGIRGLLHPAQPRRSSVETSKVAPSSLLAGRAHQRSLSCEVILARALSVDLSRSNSDNMC